MMRAAQVASERVQKAVDAVQSREELRHLYHPDREPWWRKLFSRESEGSGSLSSDPIGASSFMHALPYIVAGVVLVVVVAGLLMYFPSPMKRREKHEESDRLVRARLIAEQLEAARAARAAGDLNAALRAFWAVLVTALGRGDELMYRPAWTCREMLARSRGEGPDVELLARLLPRVEELEYGRLEITERDVDELADLCTERTV